MNADAAALGDITNDALRRYRTATTREIAQQVTYAGDISNLAAALRAAGWRVTEGGNALAIAR